LTGLHQLTQSDGYRRLTGNFQPSKTRLRRFRSSPESRMVTAGLSS